MKLLGLKGQYVGESLELLAEHVWLGRASSGSTNTAEHFFFEDQSVSRAHAVLVWSEEHGSYVIHHRSQTNPTFLNGEPLQEPRLLSLGDKISFGHQVIEYGGSGEGEDSASEPSDVEALQLAFRVAGVTTEVKMSQVLCFQFSKDVTEVEGPLDDGDGTTIYRVPRSSSSEFKVFRDPETRSVMVEGSSKSASGSLTAKHDGTQLNLPIKAGVRYEFLECDVLEYGDFECWLLNEDETSCELDLLGAFAESIGLLEFQSGPWKGASLSFSSEFKESYFLLGPGSKLGDRMFPIERAPTCKISFEDDVATFEVAEAAVGQYATLNGKLLFDGQQNELHSGSGLSLGDLMFLWKEPRLHAELSKFRLHYADKVLPIPRSQVIIGTASHCEVLLDGPGLGAMTGSLDFGPSGFVYKHLELTIPAVVDGKEVSSGREIKIEAGSVLELGLGCVLKLEKQEKT